MKISKKNKKWLYLLIAIGVILAMGYIAFTPASIMSIPFFSQAYAVVGPDQTAFAGDTFQHTFTLTNKGTETLPRALYDSDGDGINDRAIRLYKGYRLTDSAGVTVTTGCSTPDGSCNYVEEITSSLAVGGTTSVAISFSVTASTPSSLPGVPYGVSAMLFKVEQKWTRSTNTWTETPTIIDSVSQNNALAKKFAVSTQTPAPTPTPSTILAWFQNLFATIWNAIKTLFGW